MKKQIIIGTLLFLISLAGTATAQTISGKVTDAEAHPIDGATVILQSIDSTFCRCPHHRQYRMLPVQLATGTISVDIPTHSIHHPPTRRNG